MNKILKMCIPVLAAAVISVGGNAFAADFVDMPSDPVMKQALENAVENKLLNGYETGEIKPNGNITRAEMSAIITRCLGAAKTADISKFVDVSKSEWYYEALSKGVAMGAFKGDGEYLNPENNITFQETFAVVSRIFDLGEQDEASISALTDADKIDDWAMEYVLKVFTGGYWGEGITELRPNEYITRGEFAILMNKLVQVYVDEPGEYNELEDGNVVIRTGDVVINSAVNTGKIIIGDGVDSGVSFKNSDLNKIVGRGGTVELLESTKIQSIRLIVAGAIANVSGAVPKENHEYYGIKGTTFSLGAIQLK